jgi:hypothetical protein
MLDGDDVEVVPTFFNNAISPPSTATAYGMGYTASAVTLLADGWVNCERDHSATLIQQFQSIWTES